jgi:hypothetical protein
MPVILPTPDEFSALPWRSRDKALMAARSLLRGYGGAAGVDLTADAYRTRRDRIKAEDIAFGERVRAEARAMQGQR